MQVLTCGSCTFTVTYSEDLRYMIFDEEGANPYVDPQYRNEGTMRFRPTAARLSRTGECAADCTGRLVLSGLGIEYITGDSFQNLPAVSVALF
jgi:hypothetical protein